MSEIIIKAASEEHINDLHLLYRQLFKQMAQLQPDSLREADQDGIFLKNMIHAADADILIAIDKNDVAGFLLVQESHSPPYSCFVPRKSAYIMDLVVRDEQQGKGIGTRLIEAGKEWAIQRGAEYVELMVLANNDGAIKLYKRNGFQEKTFTMRADL